jgi:hypothetical protein
VHRLAVGEVENGDEGAGGHWSQRERGCRPEYAPP